MDNNHLNWLEGNMQNLNDKGTYHFTDPHPWYKTTDYMHQQPSVDWEFYGNNHKKCTACQHGKRLDKFLIGGLIAFAWFIFDGTRAI